MSTNHPANRGKAMLVAWIDAPLRDYAKQAARANGVEFSRWIERVVQQACAEESAARAIRDAEESAARAVRNASTRAKIAGKP